MITAISSLGVMIPEKEEHKGKHLILWISARPNDACLDPLELMMGNLKEDFKEAVQV